MKPHWTANPEFSMTKSNHVEEKLTGWKLWKEILTAPFSNRAGDGGSLYYTKDGSIAIDMEHFLGRKDVQAKMEKMRNLKVKNPPPPTINIRVLND